MKDKLRKELIKYKNKPWKVMEEKNDYKTFYHDETNGFRSCKADAVINKNIKLIYDYMLRLDMRGGYDKNFDSGCNLKKIDEDLYFIYVKFKGKLFVSPRDFTIIQYEYFVIK